MKNLLIGLVLISYLGAMGYVLRGGDIEEPIQAALAGEMFCVAEQKICQVVLSNTLGNSEKYQKIGAAIKSLPSDWKVNIDLTGNGGSIDTVIYFYNIIEDSAAEITTNVVGPVYSAHAMLAMLGKTVHFGADTFLMIHQPAIYDPAKGEYQVLEVACKLSKGTDRGQSLTEKCLQNMYYNSLMFNKMFDKKIKPYMTSRELDRYYKGYDVYINGDEMTRRMI